MPLMHVPPGRLRFFFVPTLVVYVLALVPFALLESGDIVSLELAGTTSKASEIVSGWSAAQAQDVAYLQGVDALHPFVYGLLFATAAVWAGRKLRGRAASWAPVVAWMALSAIVFDTIENIGMIAMIRGNLDAPVPAVTTAFAYAKFAMIICALLYAVAGLVARLRAGRGSSAN